MRTSVDRPLLPRVAAVVVAMLALAAFALAARAANPAHVDNPHGHFKDDCQLCHSSKDWKTVKVSPKFDHGKYGFPLSGAHATSNCMSCHTSLEFGQARTQCASCHADVHRGELGTDCARCHSSRSFQDRAPMLRAHQLTRFPLTGGHASVECEDCHKPAAQGHLQFVNTSLDCYSCHRAQFETAPNHVSGGFSTQCQTCHTPVDWKHGNSFDHEGAGFPLTGAHSLGLRRCDDCHHGVYTATSAECISCHQNSTPGYANATNPPHSPTNFPTSSAACKSCHNLVAWQPSLWPANHSTTAFAASYNGAHPALACTDCHNAATWSVQGTGSNCYGCHTTNYANTTNPKHDPANFPTSGCSCHNTIAWIPASAHDHTAAGFPLVGNHSLAVRTCNDCHAASGFATGATKQACESCHLNSTPGFANAGPGKPVHNTTYFPYSQCTTCHAAATAYQSWANGTYTHSTMQLTNAHATPTCENCHTGNYLTVAFNCYSCHQNSTPGYANATNPPHSPTNFPTTNAACTGCHTTIVWQPSTWPANHSTTAFAAGFTGAHVALACTDCHNASTWNVQGTGNNCYGCHATDYANTTNPKHDTTNYPTAGCTCHTTTAWSPATGFDHTAGGFPLTGNHSLAVRQCADCHAASGYGTGATSKACESCHLNSTPGYANVGAGNPAHNTTYFPYAQCTTCHTAAASSYTTWAGGKYTHSTMQLTNAHATPTCENCHAGNYLTVAFNCYSCHQNSTPGYANATNPPHSPTNFPTTNTACSGCHTTIVWQPSTWPANHSTTAFAAGFTGAHLALACTDCHNASTWNVQGTGNNCYGCHATDYANTTNPKHDTTNYPTAGCICHTTTAWSPATGFDHTAAGFPLTGNHSLTVRQCADCHAASGYGTGATSTDCYTCHAAAYNANTVVKHSTPNFPTAAAQCIACHAAANTGHVTWAGGTFSTHSTVTTGLALSGNHAGFQCSDCHTSATTDLTQYTCSVTCHNGDNRFTGHENKSCAGTTFNAAKAQPTIKACYACHPRGTSGSSCGG